MIFSSALHDYYKIFDKAIFLALAIFLLEFLSPTFVFAQDFALGAGAGLFNQSEEKGFAVTNPTLDLHFDVSSLQLGVNRTEMYFNTSLFSYSWPSKVKSDSYYLAWSLGERKGDHYSAKAGIAYQNSVLHVGNGVPAQRTQNVAWLAGAGYFLDMGSVFLGAEWLYLSGKAKFKDITIATGSNQVQLSSLYVF